MKDKPTEYIDVNKKIKSYIVSEDGTIIDVKYISSKDK
jgi:hypothetical protein